MERMQGGRIQHFLLHSAYHVAVVEAVSGDLMPKTYQTCSKLCGRPAVIYGMCQSCYGKSRTQYWPTNPKYVETFRIQALMVAWRTNERTENTDARA